MTQSKCASSFIFTINEKSLEKWKEIVNYLKRRAGCNYILVTEHIGQNNKHYHCFVQYSHSIRLSMEMLHNAHIDKCYGSAQKNIEYCRALDEKHKNLGVTAVEIYEYGKPVFKGSAKTVSDLLEIENVRDVEDPKLVNAWKTVWELVELEPIDIDDWYKEVKVYWIQGPSGIGKTNRAKQIVKENSDKFGSRPDRVKYYNGFWHGVSGKSDIAIYDDFRDSHMKPSEFIHFIDYNIQKMNVKGRTRDNRYKLIIITTVQPLNSIYRNVHDEPRKQWERRLEVIDLFPDKSLGTENGKLTYIDPRYDTEYFDWDKKECYYCNYEIECKCICVQNECICIHGFCNYSKLNKYLDN